MFLINEMHLRFILLKYNTVEYIRQTLILAQG